MIILFRGWLYRNIVSYRIIGERTVYIANNKQFIQYIDENDRKNADIEAIIKSSLRITSKKLTFGTGKTEYDPNKLIYSKKANCIGYALFYCAVCNDLLKKHHLSNWEACPGIGQLYVFGVNIHHYLHHPFLKDHDFVLIENKKTHKQFSVDPSLYDYLYINLVTCK